VAHLILIDALMMAWCDTVHLLLLLGGSSDTHWCSDDGMVCYSC